MFSIPKSIEIEYSGRDKHGHFYTCVFNFVNMTRANQKEIMVVRNTSECLVKKSIGLKQHA